MKALFDNLVLAATPSMPDASSNYPADNILSAFLKKRAQSTAAADTLTITFGADKSINCVYYGFTNATGIVILLKNSGGGTLKTITITTPEEIGAEHFAVVGSVRTIDVQLTKTGVGVYLGGLGAGLEETLPDPDAGWDEPMTDNSLVSGSPDGQYSQTYLKPLRKYSWTLPEVTRERVNELVTAYGALGLGKPLWVDPFEDDHDFVAPLYCVLTEPIQPKKNGRMYSLTLSIAEAR
jgi:hypothetical protein